MPNFHCRVLFGGCYDVVVPSVSNGLRMLCYKDAIEEEKEWQLSNGFYSPSIEQRGYFALMSTSSHCLSRYEVWWTDTMDKDGLVGPIWEKLSRTQAASILGDVIQLQWLDSFPIHSALEEQLGPLWQCNWFYRDYAHCVRRIYCEGPISAVIGPSLDPVSYWSQLLNFVTDPTKWYERSVRSDPIRWDPWRVEPMFDEVDELEEPEPILFTDPGDEPYADSANLFDEVNALAAAEQAGVDTIDDEEAGVSIDDEDVGVVHCSNDLW